MAVIPAIHYCGTAAHILSFGQRKLMEFEYL